MPLYFVRQSPARDSLGRDMALLKLAYPAKAKLFDGVLEELAK